MLALENTRQVTSNIQAYKHWQFEASAVKYLLYNQPRYLLRCLSGNIPSLEDLISQF